LAFKDSQSIMKIRSLLEEKDWVRRVDMVTGENNHAVMSRMMQMMRGMSGGGSMSGMMPEMGPGGMVPEISPSDAVRSGKMPKHVKQMLARGFAGENGRQGHDEGPKRLNLLVDDGGHRIPEIVKLIDKTGVVLESVELHEPTLDDVFLSVTGRNIRDERGSFVDIMRQHRIIREARGQRS